MTANRMEEPIDARLSVAAVAHRLGVAPATLRTWDRRYGLGPSGHTAGAHRRYSASDVVRLETMRRLIMGGVPPGEAARVASGSPSVSPGPAAPLPGFDGRLAEGGPVGQVLAMAGADAAVRGLGRAAMALDTESVSDMLRDQVARHGVLHTWDHVLCPVLVAVGARWATTGEGVEVEHSLSECAAVVLRSVGDGVLSPAGRRPVLLACAPTEQHALPLNALGAALAERRIATRMLGAALPASALEAAVRRTGPAALFVWSYLPGTADERVLAALPITRPATAVLVGGPGWAVERLPSRVTVATDLTHAVALVEQALGA